ncbi:helix-turn-helix domain-containing protein [Lactiplantibacillus herbarum]|uniref:helix-turn-helix domain-containing protein n=1 Tax=Lactiplantibacillus herbarum TaxID=1670446 RepID=UPI00064FDDD0|nr:helix-turn-helix transcriptional regulator [Lactiplantibacillus herbarum]
MALGQTLKQTRLEQHLSQRQVATGICAQSMLSAIENERYVPNARLLLALCQRLGIAVSTLSLADNFDISTDNHFNQRIQQLCNAHQYQALKDFLLMDETLASVETDEQTQAYYYYLGVAELNVDLSVDEAQRHMQLAVDLAMPQTAPSTLTRLALISLALIKVKLRHLASVATLVSQSLADIETANYESNLNIIFYLAGLVAYRQGDSTVAFQRLTTGMAFVTAHDSHYMLANYYRLMAQLAQDAGQSEAAADASQRQKMLTDLFHEQINEQL